MERGFVLFFDLHPRDGVGGPEGSADVSMIGGERYSPSVGFFVTLLRFAYDIGCGWVGKTPLRAMSMLQVSTACPDFLRWQIVNVVVQLSQAVQRMVHRNWNRRTIHAVAVVASSPGLYLHHEPTWVGFWWWWCWITTRSQE